MGERRISISLDEELYEKVRKVAAVEDVPVERWLSLIAAGAAEIAAMQQAWRQFEEIYGSPSEEVKRRIQEEMKASGHFDPETPEHYQMRMSALARLREPPPEELELPAARPGDPEPGVELERQAG